MPRGVDCDRRQGRHRGGEGIVRKLEFLRPLNVSMLSERRGDYAPCGLNGGESGALGHNSIKRAGGEIIFHKVAIRPGKPLLFARLADGTLVFGLPGNPIAAAVGLRFFVVPALRRLQDRPPEKFHAAVSEDTIHKRAGLYFFGKARAHVDATGCRGFNVSVFQQFSNRHIHDCSFNP